MKNSDDIVIGLLGASFENPNRGVGALSSAVVRLLLAHNPTARIFLLIGHNSDRPQTTVVNGQRVEIQVVNLRMSPRAHLETHSFYVLTCALLWRLLPSTRLKARILRHCYALRCIRSAEFLADIRGGDSFSDLYGVRSFILGSIPTIVSLLAGKPLVLLPQTIGPFSSNISRLMARSILKRARIVYGRDKESKKLALEMLPPGQTKDRVMFCPDVAFTLEPVAPIAFLDELREKTQGKTLVGLNVSALLYIGGYSRDNMFELQFDYAEFVRRLSQKLLDDENAYLLLIPHHFGPQGCVHSDLRWCEEVVKRCHARGPGRVGVVDREFDQQELKAIIGSCSFFIGSRMHACIAALSQYVPAVGVAYSRKFQGVFDSVGAGDLVVDARQCDEGKAINKIINLYTSREDLRKMLIPKIHAAKELIADAFSHLCDQAWAKNVT